MTDIDKACIYQLIKSLYLKGESAKSIYIQIKEQFPHVSKSELIAFIEELVYCKV